VTRLPPLTCTGLVRTLAPTLVPPPRIAVGLGCSLGDRERTLNSAVRALAAVPGLTLQRTSRWYRTPPMRGGTATGWFLNGVVVLTGALDPLQILAHCRALEDAWGRRRARHWGDRPLDLDVLLIEGVALQTATLTLPHPGIAQRPFVWRPLLEVWPHVTDPRTNTRVAQRRNRLDA